MRANAGKLAKKLAKKLVGRLLEPTARWRAASALGPGAVAPLRIALLGTCQLELLVKAIDHSRHTLTHALLQAREHFPIPEPDPADDLVVMSVNLRHILASASALPVPASDMALARTASPQDAEALLERAGGAVARFVDRVAQVYGSRPVVFISFFEPGPGYYGATHNPYALTEPREFTRRLNAMFAEHLETLPSFHLLDMNEILSHVGREFLQDDVLMHSSHASFINDWNFKLDRKRQGKARQLASAVGYERAIRHFGQLFIDRLETIHRVTTQDDPVKLIICDLDDTLWRGVAAEDDGMSDEDRIAGWPLGLVEALLFFKARGGILALCSKNDLGETARRFERIYQGALALDDFAVVRVNWERKSRNISEILAETNLLARNGLFIDDNVREVAEARAVHPDLRCLGTDYYNWRRIVLSAPETQVATITDESRRRTALVRASAQRAAALDRPAEDREAWLKSLDLRQTITVLRGAGGKRYERALELINKTNQFNTTGQRRTAAEMRDFLSGGGFMLVSTLADRTIDNGLIAVCLVAGDEIAQMVLSCRVFGLGAEAALAAAAVRLILADHPRAYARLSDTGRNRTCHGFFASLGFARDGERFAIDHEVAAPDYIAVSA